MLYVGCGAFRRKPSWLIISLKHIEVTEAMQWSDPFPLALNFLCIHHSGGPWPTAVGESLCLPQTWEISLHAHFGCFGCAMQSSTLGANEGLGNWRVWWTVGFEWRNKSSSGLASSFRQCEWMRRVTRFAITYSNICQWVVQAKRLLYLCHKGTLDGGNPTWCGRHSCSWCW